ncbi:MAG: DUF1156 domain-containing protein, partial [Alphaproteobacteria bacterium]
TRPLVVDPFAGGGSIPLEALRVGADAFASDLNPVAVLLNKVVLEYIPKYGQRLADEVRKWGQWVKEEAEKELAEFYPKDEDGSTPIAYLWARTIISEAPDDGSGIPVEVPLMRSLWLAKKAGRYKALRWVRDTSGVVQTEVMDVTYADGLTRKVRRPLLEIFEPKNEKDVEKGTVARGSGTCPVTGFTTPVASVKRQLKERKGGAVDSRLISIVLTKSSTQGRFYRLPNEEDLASILKATAKLDDLKNKHQKALSLIPNESTEHYHTFVNRGSIYGMLTWEDYFTSRQCLSLGVLSQLVHELEIKLLSLSNDGIELPIKTCLAFIVDKIADKSSSLCRWKSSAEYMAGNTFARQALPMVFDFCEVNLLGGATGDIMSEVDWVEKMLNHCSKSVDHKGQAEKSSATNHPLPDQSANVFITDPPYYFSMQYADLADFFYVWLRRSLSKNYPEFFVANLIDKEDEIIVQSPGHEFAKEGKNSAFYESRMQIALSEGSRILTTDGIGVVVFAHTSTRGWEAMLQAMVDAGWIITAAWSIDTEMSGRVIAQNRSVLASSVHLVCRPRDNNDIGDWRDVLQQLPIRIKEWMPRLTEQGVVGADAIFACLGPALEIFSRYSSVEKASGEIVPLREYLEYVWAAISKEALSTIFKDADTSNFEEDARLTAMWLWTLS